MLWYETLLLLLGTLVVFMAIGMPVVFAFFAANLLGAYWFMGGDNGVLQLVRNAVDSVQSFALLPIPLFILMGEIMFHTGVAARAIDAVDKMISRVPGRLSLVAIIGGTLFSSLSGSTIANTAMLGSTLLPEMYRRGYKPAIAIGPIVAVGGIAMLIPPSALAVLLGSIAQIPIGQLLIASIVPAILLAVLFFAYVVIRCTLDPSLAPGYDIETLSWRERLLPFIKYVLPLSLIFIVVVGSILAGIATPTESAALGCGNADCRRRLSLPDGQQFRHGHPSDLALYRDDLVHHLWLDYLFADHGVFAGLQWFGQCDFQRRARSDRVVDRHVGHPAVSWLLHGSGEHDDDHRPLVHAHRAATRP